MSVCGRGSGCRKVKGSRWTKTVDTVEPIGSCLRPRRECLLCAVVRPTPSAARRRMPRPQGESKQTGADCPSPTPGLWPAYYYSDELRPATHGVTVTQSEQVLISRSRKESSGESAPAIIQTWDLTQQWSNAKLVSSTVKNSEARGPRQVLTALADATAFLDARLRQRSPSDAPPNKDAQRHMISSTVDYLHSTMPSFGGLCEAIIGFGIGKLPDMKSQPAHVNPEPMHVIYGIIPRQRCFIAMAATSSRRRRLDAGRKIRYLITFGTFGPASSCNERCDCGSRRLDLDSLGRGRCRWRARSLWLGGSPRRTRNTAYGAAGCCTLQMATVEVGSKSGPAMTARCRSMRRAERSFT